MLKRLSALLLATAIVCSSGARQAESAILVSFGGPVEIEAGGSGQLDVFVASDDNQDLLDLFGAEFRITPVVGAGLEFQDPQGDTQTAASNYVFAGNSLGGPLGLVSTVTNFGDTYIGGDATLDRQGVAGPFMDRLLFRLDLDASGALAGNQFLISLIDSLQTFFSKPDFSSLDVDRASFTNFGTANIIPSSTAVPEPGSLLLLLAGAAVLCLKRRGVRLA